MSAPKCSCTHEAGDTDCAVHPTCGECGESIEDTALATAAFKARDEAAMANAALDAMKREYAKLRQQWDSGVAEMTKASYAQVSLVTNRLHETERERDSLRAQLAKVRADLTTMIAVHDDVERERDELLKRIGDMT